MTPERFQLSGGQQVSRTAGTLPQFHQLSPQSISISTLIDRPEFMRVQVPAVVAIRDLSRFDEPRMHADPLLEPLVTLARSQPGERLGHLGPALLE